MNKEMFAEFDRLRSAMIPIMAKKDGNIERVTKCTLTEEFIHWNGWAFTNDDMESDCWKYLAELFHDAVDDDDNGTLVSFKETFMYRCGITELVLQVKYPILHKLLEKK